MNCSNAIYVHCKSTDLQTAQAKLQPVTMCTAYSNKHILTIKELTKVKLYALPIGTACALWVSLVTLYNPEVFLRYSHTGAT